MPKRPVPQPVVLDSADSLKRATLSPLPPATLENGITFSAPAPDPYVAPAEPPPRVFGMPVIVATDDLRKQLTDLAELIANGRVVRDSVFLADAAKRVAALRVTLGL